jgi:hypothetical protein
MPVMVAKTAPYPPGVGFRVFPYNITKEATTILRLTLRRVTPTNFIAGPLATIDNKAIPLIKICIFQAIALYLHV